MMKNKKQLFVLMILVAMFAIGIATVQAEGIEPYPSYTITSVTVDQSVSILTLNFPADTEFIVRMKDLNSVSDYIDVAKFNTQSGGSFTATFPIPAELVGKKSIGMLLSNNNGIEIPSTFSNEAMTETVATVCDYSVLPSFTIDSVVKGKSITVTTGTFPANQSFTVKMGYYAAGAPAAHHHCGGHDCPTSDPWYPWMDPDADVTPAPSPEPEMYPIPDPSFSWLFGPMIPGCGTSGCVNFHLGGATPHAGLIPTYFVGFEVGTYDSADGSPQTVSYDIPEELKGYSPIIVRFEDKGSCGFYGYNYFWNADFPVTSSESVPEVQIETVSQQ
ncbi:MAG TPA: hypothetical protein PKX37_02865 [Flexilinea sp.]|nr:hypothetical protein [Flexilinea sp.]